MPDILRKNINDKTSPISLGAMQRAIFNDDATLEKQEEGNFFSKMFQTTIKPDKLSD